MYPHSKWTDKLKRLDAKGENILSDKLQCINVLNGEREVHEDGSLGKLRIEQEEENQDDWREVEMTDTSLQKFFNEFYFKELLPVSKSLHCEESNGITLCNDKFYSSYDKLKIAYHKEKPWVIFYLIYESQKRSEVYVGVQGGDKKMSVYVVPNQGSSGYIHRISSWRGDYFAIEVEGSDGRLKKDSCTVSKNAYSYKVDCGQGFYRSKEEEQETEAEENICETIDCEKFQHFIQ